MPYLYIGTKGKIVVIDAGTGKTIKEIIPNQSMLKSGNGFVTMIKNGGFLYAHTYGRLYCIEINSGKIIWSNELKGLGYDLATMISDDDNNSRGNMIASKMKDIDDQRRSVD
jgi:outer membrane protein assembly factor BamB